MNGKKMFTPARLVPPWIVGMLKSNSPMNIALSQFPFLGRKPGMMPSLPLSYFTQIYFYLRTSMIHLHVHLSPKSPLWRWDGCGLAGTTILTKEITRSLVQNREIESGKDAMRHCYGRVLHITISINLYEYDYLYQYLWESFFQLLLLIKEMHWWVKWYIHFF